MKGQAARGTDAENAAFLSSVQAKLRDQAKSLADRMKARALENAGDSFNSFVKDMDQASVEMGPAVDRLKGAKWQDALGAEEKALQYILRAEATFRTTSRSPLAAVAAGAVAGAALRAIWKASSTWSWIPKRISTKAPGRRSRPTRASARSATQCRNWRNSRRRQQELAEQQKKEPAELPSSVGSRSSFGAKPNQLRQQMEQLTRGDQALSRDLQQQPGPASKGSKARAASRAKAGNRAASRTDSRASPANRVR